MFDTFYQESKIKSPERVRIFLIIVSLCCGLGLIYAAGNLCFQLNAGALFFGVWGMIELIGAVLLIKLRPSGIVISLIKFPILIGTIIFLLLEQIKPIIEYGGLYKLYIHFIVIGFFIVFLLIILFLKILYNRKELMDYLIDKSEEKSESIHSLVYN